MDRIDRIEQKTNYSLRTKFGCYLSSDILHFCTMQQTNTLLGDNWLDNLVRTVGNDRSYFFLAACFCKNLSQGSAQAVSLPDIEPILWM